MPVIIEMRSGNIEITQCINIYNIRNRRGKFKNIAVKCYCKKGSSEKSISIPLLGRVLTPNEFIKLKDFILKFRKYLCLTIDTPVYENFFGNYEYYQRCREKELEKRNKIIDKFMKKLSDESKLILEVYE